MLRTVISHLGKKLVFKRHLPRDFGGSPILVSPAAALSYWYRDLNRVDPFLFLMVGELVKPNSIVWDIGANIGLFSFAAAQVAARVIAVEPDPWLGNLLHRSTELNGLPVTVVPAAVSDRCGVTTLHIADRSRASNSLDGPGQPQRVASITLDSMLQHYPAPDILKIDVEGWEYPVLTGAAHVLRHGPVIWCEVTRNHKEISGLLKESGYTIYAARASERKPIPRACYDTLAVCTATP